MIVSLCLQNNQIKNFDNNIKVRPSLIEMASESLERSELRAMQRERERERRRMRDRQRRQSMSVEERENHLARRRRNYQLRRQRVGNGQSDSQSEQTSIASVGKKITAIENQAIVPFPGLSVQCGTATKQGNGQTIVEGPRSEGMFSISLITSKLKF